jgi:hypothetical protein
MIILDLLSDGMHQIPVAVAARSYLLLYGTAHHSD